LLAFLSLANFIWVDIVGYRVKYIFSFISTITSNSKFKRKLHKLYFVGMDTSRSTSGSSAIE